MECGSRAGGSEVRMQVGVPGQEMDTVRYQSHAKELRWGAALHRRKCFFSRERWHCADQVGGGALGSVVQSSRSRSSRRRYSSILLSALSGTATIALRWRQNHGG